MIVSEGRTLLYKETEALLMGPCQTNSATKFIPDAVLNGDADVQKAFLSGYVDGDGFVSNCPELTTKSRKLANQITYLLSNLGVVASITRKVVRGSMFYRVFIPDQESKMNFRAALAHSTKDLAPLDMERRTRSHSKYGIPSDIVAQYILRLNVLTRARRKGAKWSKRNIMATKVWVLYWNYLAKRPVSRTMTRESLGLLLELYGTRIGELMGDGDRATT